MEVHAHTHTERKKWTHYLWEFLMLFLAVFCGFLAENLREHKIEKDREKQFMQSLVRDIKKDISQGDNLQVQNLKSQKVCDSLLVLLSGKEINNNSYPAYSLWHSVNGFIDFIPNDGTIQQLKNSGALRMVRKQDVVDRLMEYNKVIELIKIHQSVMNAYLFQQSKKTELFDVIRLTNETDRINVPLLSNDKKLVGWGYEYINGWKGLLDALNSYVEAAKTRGKDLLQSVNKEYYLE
jgi:hypothetical protein